MVADIGFSPVPEPFRSRMKNVALLIEEDVTDEIRRESGIEDDETLLGFYHGVPHTARGEGYGIGITLPDRIYVFKRPIEEEAREMDMPVRKVIEETIWHEVAHHFGLDEDEVERRERERDSP